MKKVGCIVSMVLLLVCTSCSSKIDPIRYPDSIKNLDQLKQFRLIWEKKTKQILLEEGVQFMSGDWDYDFLNVQILQKAIEREKIDSLLGKDHLNPDKLVAQWNMGLNVPDGINRFKNLMKECVQELLVSYRPIIDWEDEKTKTVEEEISKLEEKILELEIKIERLEKGDDIPQIHKILEQIEALREKMEELEKFKAHRLLSPYLDYKP